MRSMLPCRSSASSRSDSLVSWFSSLVPLVRSVSRPRRSRRPRGLPGRRPAGSGSALPAGVGFAILAGVALAANAAAARPGEDFEQLYLDEGADRY